MSDESEKGQLAAKLAGLTKQQKLQLLDAIEEKKRRKREARIAFVPHEGQLPIIHSEANKRIVIAGNGCWAPGTLVRMFDGSTRAVEDVKVGDLLMGPDSTQREVLRLYQGEEQMYRIVPKWSAPYTVNASHKLSIYRWDHEELKYEEPLVSEFVNWSEERRRVSYQWRPKDGIEYSEKTLPLDPYIFGTWLGDGSSRSLAITTMDEVIKQAWDNEFQDYFCRQTIKEGNKASTYSYTQHLPGKGSEGLQKLVTLGVKNNKHIPDIYMTASIDQRLQLLAGLVDTDGYYNGTVGIEIIQVRKGLAAQIRELAHSLGFAVSSDIKIINGVEYYRQYIYGSLPRIPTRLVRKQVSAEYKKQRENWREPFTVEDAGTGAFYGFTVSKDNLLLLADYTVQRNSGKTALGVNEAMWALDGYNPITGKYTPVPARIVVLLDSPEKVGDVWLPELKKWRAIDDEQLHKRGKPYITEITWHNGSTVRFMFHEQSPMSFESLEADFVVCDEPPARNVWIALLRSGRKKNSKARFIMIATPISQAWIRQYYVEWEKGNYPDTEFFKGSTIQNAANLAEGYIEEFSKHLTEAEKRTRLHGEFFNTDGMALAGLWKREKHLVREADLPPNYKQEWPHVISVDFHPNKPLYACIIAAAPDGKRYYVNEYAKKILPREFALWLKQNWLVEYRVVDIIGDNYGSGDYTGGIGFKSAIEVMNEVGVRIRATTYDEKGDDAFMERLQEGLFVPDLGEPMLQFLLTKSAGVIRDIENVQWKKIKGTEDFQPKLEISNTDYLACLKYALAANLTFDNARRKIHRIVSNSPWAGKSKDGGYMQRNWAAKKDMDDDDW